MQQGSNESNDYFTSRQKLDLIDVIGIDTSGARRLAYRSTSAKLYQILE